MTSVDTLQTAASSIGGDLLDIAPTGLAIAASLLVVRVGWSVLWWVLGFTTGDDGVRLRDR